MHLNEKRIKEQYRPYIIKLTIFKDVIHYESDHDFTNKELRAITPAGISAGCVLKFMAIPNPNPTIIQPKAAHHPLIMKRRPSPNLCQTYSCIGMNWQTPQSEILPNQSR